MLSFAQSTARSSSDQLLKAHLELGSAARERRALAERRIDLGAEMSQALRRAGKPVAERFESQLLEEPARGTDMVGILRADQKVAVYPATLDGPEAQAQLDIWEDQVDLGEATLIDFRRRTCS
jgi:hypothetical protein